MPPSLTDLFNHPPTKHYKEVRSQSLYLTMRDGVSIAVDVMLPKELPAETRLPLIMIMARYWRSLELNVPEDPNAALIGPRENIVNDLLSRGFAVMVVDARGTGASGGTSIHPWSPDELADYGEVVRWACQQAWSNGCVGAVGISYEGSTAQYLLTEGGAAVKAVAPMEFEFDVYPDIAFPGGIFNESFIAQWAESNRRLDSNKVSNLFPFMIRFLVKGVRPVDADRATREQLQQALRDHQANTDVYQATRHITYRDDVFGNTRATFDDFSVFKRQAQIEQSNGSLFIWGSWLDGTTADTVLRSFNTLSNPQIGVIGAWKHEMTAHGSPYLTPNSKPNPLQQQQWDAVSQFFAQTLQADEPLQGKTLYYYTLGEELWKKTDQFPLPHTQNERWYFHADQGLAPHLPDEDGQDSYRVDFEATTGKTNRWQTQFARPLIYRDRRKDDQRLLTYTSQPLAHDLEITGYPCLTLFVAVNQTDAGFFVYLEDVDPRGTVRYITEGQLRAIHRVVSTETPPYWYGMPYHSFKQADSQPLPQGEMVEVRFGLQPTSVLIRKGHRVRVALAGADRDTFAPVPHQGTVDWKVAYGGGMASYLELPTVPR